MAMQSGNGESSQTYASRRGRIAWAFYDWASNAFAAVILTFVFAPYFSRQVVQDEMRGTALWGVTLGVAGMLVALGAPILGATMDQRGRRKPWLASFTLLCIVAMAALWFVEPSPASIWLAIVLVAVAELGSEFAGVLYNAMLPSLVPPQRIGRWSGWGWTMGYLGGLLCLILVLIAFVLEGTALFTLDQEAAHHLRATFPVAALWFLIFALPLLLWTPDTPSTGMPLRRAVRAGIDQVIATIRQVRHYANIARFLVARIIFIDALATVFAFGGIYASGTFGMNAMQILLFGITLNISAGVGAFGFSWVDDWLGGKRTILLALVGLIVPGILLLIVESMALFWTVGLVFGVFVGPAQAASRSLMARIAPPQLRNQMFGFYAFSGKIAFLCPLLVAGLTYLSGSQRVGISVIILFFVVGLLVMLTVREPETRPESHCEN